MRRGSGFPQSPWRGETGPHGMRRPVWPPWSAAAVAVAAWGKMEERDEAAFRTTVAARLLLLG